MPDETFELTPELSSMIEAGFAAEDGPVDDVVESAEPAAEAAAVEPIPVADKQQVASRNRQKAQAKVEEADELVDEGLVGEGGEDVEAEEAVTDEEPAAEEEKVVVPAVAEKPAAIDPMHRFAAQEAGWTDKDINDFAKANPALAARTFTTLAEAYTNLSRQYLPATSPVAPGTEPKVEPAQSDAPASSLDALYKDLAGFAEANGTELVDKFLKPLQAEVIGPLKALLAENRVTQQRLLATEANGAFEGLSKGFEGLYGKDVASLSDGQRQSRQQLGILADQIRAGAKSQGKDLSVTEALKRAHGVLSADFVKTTARKELTDQVQRRSQQITARPTTRKAGRSEVAGYEKASNAYSAKLAEFGLDD